MIFYLCLLEDCDLLFVFVSFDIRGGSVYIYNVTILTQACLLDIGSPLFVPGLEGPVSHPPKGGAVSKFEDLDSAGIDVPKYSVLG